MKKCNHKPDQAFVRKVTVHKSGKTSNRGKARHSRLKGAWGESLRSQLIKAGTIVPA